MEHTVTFRLKHSTDSPEETDFLSALEELAEIPGVKNFRIRRQVSPKNSIPLDYRSISTATRLSGILQSSAP
jgi:hypothetical protein